MNVQSFLANFEHILSAPAGIDKIRNVALSLAFEGKLSKHSSVHVDDLLISLEKLQHGSRRKRSSGDKGVIGYHSIPPHWQWVTLYRVCYGWGQTKPSSDFTMGSMA